jgi:predicted RNA-binding Zn-ribbon protein involved in translation (DUF1610 family)
MRSAAILLNPPNWGGAGEDEAWRIAEVAGAGDRVLISSAWGNGLGGGVVSKAGAVHFNCPNCNALYHVVKVEAGSNTVDRQSTCRECGAPLPSRDGKSVCKYLLLREPTRRDLRTRRGSQRHRR